MANEATSNDTVKTSLNRANPNSLPDMNRKIKMGSVLEGHVPQHLFGVDMDALGANVGNLATLDALSLPDGSKAAEILRAYAKTATAGAGVLTVVAPDATPGTGEIAVAPNGNIVSLAADALTDVDLVYVPQRGDVVDSAFPVASDVLTLPSSITDLGAIAALEVEALEGTATGNKIVLTPAAGAPAAGQARLNVAKTTVTFAAADAVTRARVKVLVAPKVTEKLEAVLAEAASTS